ncbi:MAG TPA: glycosyltransferase family 39 protein [Ktedonobacteraceae bacterium]|nr:glycosyltransferase family 39 protein [Ktedonobacteraceae bacterium]
MQSSLSDKEESSLSSPRIDQPGEQVEVIRPEGSISWWEALKQIAPIYIATHIVFLALTYLAALFSLANFSSNSLPLKTLLVSWNRWDTSQFTHIAIYGYDASYRMVFFPLFPLLEHILALVVHDPFIAGLIISNLATLGMFMIFYRLVVEDFGADRAWRSVLYLAIFPTALFFAAAYNESLFIFFSILSFYYMRKGRWWLAGLAALFASLTRSIAICLFIPFAYEYMRQRDFQWRRIDFSVLSGVGIIGGILIFCLYGYLKFHDALAFMHAQKVWDRQLTFPWMVFQVAYRNIRIYPILSFTAIHTLMDLSAILFILLMLVLSFWGPWKFAREQWSYVFYACALYLFVILAPEGGSAALSSLSRFMLEIFPAFIVAAAIGKRRNFNLYYLTICLPLLGFIVLQWLTGGWIV